MGYGNSPQEPQQPSGKTKGTESHSVNTGCSAKGLVKTVFCPVGTGNSRQKIDALKDGWDEQTY